MRFARSILILSSLLAALTTPAQTPRVLNLTSPDGTILKATFFPAAKPGPGLLLLHQCNRQRKVWDDLAQKFAASGINVLTLDFRGFGESTGTPIDKLSQDQIQDLFDNKFPLDVDTAYKFLASQPTVTPNIMAAGGASCGVNQAVLLASRHPEVKALVLLSEATFRPGRVFLRNHPNLPIFAAVADDDPDPAVVEFMEWIYSFSTNPINKFDHFPKGGHGVELFALHKDLPAEIVTWLTNALSPHSIIPATRAPALAEHQNHFLNQIDDPANAPKAQQLYAEAHQRYPKETIFPELLMNRLAYEYLQSGNIQTAIALFQLNVTAFPDSPNVYDSLADAYIANHQTDLARQNEQKALNLLPRYTKYSEAQSKALRDAAQQKLSDLSTAPH